MLSSSNILKSRWLLELYLKSCSSSGPIPDVFQFLDANPTATTSEKAEVCTTDLVRRWQAGLGLDVEVYLEKVPELAADVNAKLALIAAEFRCRRELGMEPSIVRFVERFFEIGDVVRQRLLSEFEEPAGKLPPTALMAQASDTSDDLPNAQFATAGRPDSDAGAIPASFGNYRVERILGDGGFGRVYLAFDDELRRRVAIKVPHASRITTSGDVDAYLEEARILASLDHAAIVPVYNFGRSDDCRCYTVSKYIEGADLATKIKTSPLTVTAAAEMIAHVAEALHYSHLQGVIHRDVKPANILIDLENRPYIADFGIALKEEDIGKDRPTAGTPAYMSPEQLRGEGHLVDGRTDIFSLGIVLYELLSGRRPFGRTRGERTSPVDARPLRQIDESISPELERICLKALAHRVAERYTTARDMAEDLRHFVNQSSDVGAPALVRQALSGSGSRSSSDNLSHTNALTIVPKGLRSFDRDDAGFFLELLPGPRDREGLPESVRFWKTQILEQDSDRTFRVGLVYGPSGCGKSSFLKAGVLPQLPDNVIRVFVESTARETEMRLLNALRRQCPMVACDLDLSTTMAALRRGRDLRAGTKVLIVIDQFEQWLHSHQDVESSEIVRALRQCDGEHLQCLVAVRDDFWMAITHLMEALDVSLIPGRNLASIDLFNVRHAKKVLTAMGRAYGALPVDIHEVDSAQKSFVERAVGELAQNGQVIPVQLALFAEMVKDKVWISATLKDIGGTAGVGVTFLEETFNGRSANPHHRLHQKAARSVLSALIEEQSGDIKGGMRSYHELLNASAYQQERDFDGLLRILDSELRLITPTDPDGSITDDPRDKLADKEQFYHLTHDYLVHSIREWLTQKQRQTRRGRAELLLCDRARTWEAQASNRTLPTFFEWLQVISLVPRRHFNSHGAAQAMMRRATRYYLIRSLAGLCVLVALVCGLYDVGRRTRARSLVESLQTAASQDVPGIVGRLKAVRSWADPLLRASLANTTPGSRAHTHLSIGLLPDDIEQEKYLFQEMLSADPDSLAVIRDAIAHNCDTADIAAKLWSIAGDNNQDAGRRFRAGVALAGLPDTTAVDSKEWIRCADFVANELVNHVADNPNQFPKWTTSLYSVRNVLTHALARVFFDTEQREARRDIVAAILAEYVADQPATLIELLLEATPQQHRPLFARLEAHAQNASSLLQSTIDEQNAGGAGQLVRSQLARKRARAAVIMFGLGASHSLFQCLEQPHDPELSAFAEERVSMLVLKPEVLREKLLSTASSRLRAALLRTLGGISPNGITPALRTDYIHTFDAAFRNDSDAGVHSAAEWALRKWGAPIPFLTAQPAKDKNWWVNSQGQTMIIIRGPVSLTMGSERSEPGRDDKDESQVSAIIDHSFAISTSEVSMEQYLRFQPDFKYPLNQRAPELQCPVNAVSWVDAALYCQWLNQQENIPAEEWCYPEVRVGMKLPDNFLNRYGYRLPTEAEWEYACRADTVSRFSFGNDASLLPRYAWYQDNSQGRTWPIRSLKPSALGTFDMHGNVKEWCHGIYRDEILFENGGETEPLREGFQNPTRGGGFIDLARDLRSANRRGDSPIGQPAFSTGFRVVRTMRVP